MRLIRGISQVLRIALLLTACAFCSQKLSAQNNNSNHRVRNIVLVHGAWADGSGWKGVYDILVNHGYNVSLVREPETSFLEDVRASWAATRSKSRARATLSKSPIRRRLQL